jgi:hypothetical protein
MALTPQVTDTSAGRLRTSRGGNLRCLLELLMHLAATIPGLSQRTHWRDKPTYSIGSLQSANSQRRRQTMKCYGLLVS